MWAILAPIFNALIAPITKAIAFAAAFFTGRRQGQQQERLRQAEEGRQAQERMNEAESRGPRTGDDAADRLRGGRF